MWMSRDAGAHWESLKLNLPPVPVTDIKVHHKDLVVSTQGRSFWILDNITPLHELTAQSSVTAVHLYKPRDGYRTRVSPTLLGPAIEYHLPSAPSGPVVIDVLDEKGGVVNSYNSDAPPAPAGGRGRGAGAADEEGDQEGGGRGRFTPPPKVTKETGLNRFVWDVRDRRGLTVPPGAYQAQLKVSETTATQAFNVLIDPRVAQGGVTVADLEEQYDHNVRMRAMIDDVNQLIARLRAAQAKGQDPRLDAIAGKLLTEPVRYGRPGLQAQITYLAGMTTAVDQKIGRDAIERYGVLRKELDAVRAQLDRITNGR